MIIIDKYSTELNKINTQAYDKEFLGDLCMSNFINVAEARG